MLRIIAGKFGGRKIEQPKLEITRPTMDRVREAIFSSIQFQINNAIVLDLFSGSGIFSFESISRGVIKAIAVEQNLNAIKIIRENQELLKVSNIEIIKSDAVNYVTTRTGIKFNFIFVDPPYDQLELYNKTLSGIAKNDLLETGGLIIVETNDKKNIEIPKGYMIQKEKQYGKIFILYISKYV